VKKWASRSAVNIKAVGMKLDICKSLPIASNSRRTATDIYVALKGGIKWSDSISRFVAPEEHSVSPGVPGG
jgi:hypothetical protein